MSPPLQGYSNAPIYDDWNREEYAKFLHLHLKKWGISENEIINESGEYLNFLENVDDTIKVFDKDMNLVSDN